MKVLVTPRSVTHGGHPTLGKLRAAGCEVLFCTPGQQPDQNELLRLLPGCAGYLAGVEPVSARVLEAAADLRVISRNGTGIDSIDLEAAKARGILVLRAEGANARGVAELALGQIFALARGTLAADAALKRGAWERPTRGVEVEGKTLGIAGCGRIGRIVAEMALGIGMKVVAFDPFPDTCFTPGEDFRYAPLDEVITGADFLSIHCPPTAEGKPLLDAVTLARLKTGVFLLNMSRYEIFDTDSVLAALDSGQVAGLALDVFDTEPPTDQRLARHPHVIATPHIGGFTRESVDRAMTAAVDNLIGALRGAGAIA
jgi:D-3-phosphoglycerate dehydrogenase / 2-oxoglutarate reductase